MVRREKKSVSAPWLARYSCRERSAVRGRKQEVVEVEEIRGGLVAL